MLMLHMFVVDALTFTSVDYHAYCGLYYKPMTIGNDESRVVYELKTSLTDNARIVIYNCHVFIVQATEWVKVYQQSIYK